MRKNFHLSLHHALIISLTSQVLIVVGLTSYFSWRNGQKTVEALALRLSREVTSHTQQHIDNYLNTPTLFLNINRIFADSQRLNLDKIDDLQNLFWLQAQINPQVNTIYFGSETGDFIEVEMKDAGRVAIRDSSTAPYWETYHLNEKGQKTQKIGREEYDPRQRPWYQAAINQGKLVWSPIYLFIDPPVLGITPAIPLLDNDTGQPKGVMAIDLTLNDISKFLSSLKISSSGRVFIVEKSGEIVATSTNNPLVVTTENGSKRLNSENSQDNLVRNTAQFLNSQFEQFQNINIQQQLIFKLNGDRYFVQAKNLNTHPGLDWLIVTVIPESDFMEYIRANTYTTLLLSFLAAFSSACLRAIASQWIAKSVTNLSQVAQALSSGEIRQIDEQPKIAELAVFTRCFNLIASKLQTSLHNLETVESRYKQEVVERTKSLQEDNQKLNRLAHIDSLTQIYNRYHFDLVLQQIWQQAIREKQETALIMCDVDHFKLYNDTYGHLAGDRCLYKVAQAINSAVQRGQDVATRYGGEEFAIILPNTKIIGAVRVAKKMRNTVNKLRIAHSTSTVQDYITVSCGVASFLPNATSDPQDLIKRADRALYQAKLQGRDCIVVEDRA
ncbi:putative Diguanylate cyclase/phosphodiesterase [Hyella patelloides LEGE 07179]|uniref:Putative Diguanylate cyclase/phosphodiesterase n=1 Tax=Hyella patelloides LEGE 07179 TaxID=945734 RepID=A0A563VIQ0_9CYAN|nr:diguanylate cyclase [Hyella patelloides]VEP11273.1 putative Diguanylate cyclase/phosphodiesterase [Hyella patelloides LEGE 07179]